MAHGELGRPEGPQRVRVRRVSLERALRPVGGVVERAGQRPEPSRAAEPPEREGGDHAEDEQPRVSAPLTPAVRELAELPVGAAPTEKRHHGLHAERDHRQQARALEAQVIDGGARGAKPGPADEDEQGDDQQERRRGEPGRAQGWRPVGLDETPVDPGLGVRDARAHRVQQAELRALGQEREGRHDEVERGRADQAAVSRGQVAVEGGATPPPQAQDHARGEGAEEAEHDRGPEVHRSS